MGVRWGIVTLRLRGHESSRATSRIWDLLVTAMGRQGVFGRGVFWSDSIIKNIPGVVWRVWSGSGKNEVQRNWMTCPRTQMYLQQSPHSLISTQSCFPRRCRFWEFWSLGYQLGGGEKVGKGWFLKAESSPFLAVQILSRGDNGTQSWMKGLPAPSQHSLLPASTPSYSLLLTRPGLAKQRSWEMEP